MALFRNAVFEFYEESEDIVDSPSFKESDTERLIAKGLL